MTIDLPPGQVTELLNRFHAGDRSAYQELMELTYQSVRALARNFFRRERPGHTLEPTALAHEAFIKLFDAKRLGDHRGEFLAVLATAIRRVLIEHARKRSARKRREQVKFEMTTTADAPESWDLLALDEALNKLERVDERRFRVVHLRFFLGMTIEQIAAELPMSVRAVHNDLKAARLWLLHEMTRAQK